MLLELLFSIGPEICSGSLVWMFQCWMIARQFCLARIWSALRYLGCDADRRNKTGRRRTVINEHLAAEDRSFAMVGTQRKDLSYTMR